MVKKVVVRVWVIAFFVTVALFGSLLSLPLTQRAYAAAKPGGVWVSPTTDGNTYEPGVWYTIKVRAYSPAGVSLVNVTAGDPWGHWYVFCALRTPDAGTVDTYTCQTDFRPAGVYFGGGTIHLSFDVYGRDGGLNQAPNGERTEIYKNSRLGGTWNSPDNGSSIIAVSNYIHFSANAWPSDGGHPIDHVAFTALYAGSWHTVCTQGRPNVHEFGCDWYPFGVAAGNISVSFDVYTTVPGETAFSPNGVHTINVYYTSNTKANNAIIWAMNQVNTSPKQYYGFCETFVEKAYNNQFRYGSAQQAHDSSYFHVANDWSPAIGALVFFKLYNQQDGMWDGHVGIYIGNGQFISALQSSPIVEIRTLTGWSASYPYEGWANVP